MNFFERQVQARRMSTRLLVLFGLAVVGIVLAVDAAVWIAWGPRDGGPPSPGLLAFASIATLAVIGLGSLYRIASLRSGGDAVAAQLGGVPVPEDTTDLSLRRLRNVVEEIAIASGVPMPALFVLEHEAGINAFAAGYAPSDAAVAVTRGALDRLNRDELQGVIAHEFSHILNGDMRLNIRLMGLLFGILMLGLIGRKVLYLGSGGRLEREVVGDQAGREHLALVVVGHHAVVVRLARERDLVLGAREFLGQLHHVLAGLEFGVGLDGHQQATKRAFQRGLAAPQFGHGRGIARRRLGRGQAGLRRAARGRDRLERAALVREVGLRGLDQVGDEVEAPLQLHVDLGKGVLVGVAGGDEAVVDRHTPEHDDGD